ncbi:MAG: flagellar hook-basal body complex protein [Planctomycetota bacterium]
MRTPRFPTSALLVLFTACQTVPAPLPADPVAQQLLQAALATQTTQHRVHAENLANATTCAYKRRVVQARGEANMAGQAVPVVAGIVPVFSQGPLVATGRELDVAIDGDGFLAVLQLDGSTAYTRDGQLQIDADGKLVTCRGEAVLPQITVPADTLAITIAADGLFSGRTAGSPDSTTFFGQITLNRFVNPAGMRLAGANYCPSDASGSPITAQPGLSGCGQLRQGYLECSNVDSAAELVELRALEQRRAALVSAIDG